MGGYSVPDPFVMEFCSPRGIYRLVESMLVIGLFITNPIDDQGFITLYATGQ